MDNDNIYDNDDTFADTTHDGTSNKGLIRATDEHQLSNGRIVTQRTATTTGMGWRLIRNKQTSGETVSKVFYRNLKRNIARCTSRAKGCYFLDGYLQVSILSPYKSQI